MKKNKYDFSNGFVIITDLNKTNGIEEYIDKLYLVEKIVHEVDNGKFIEENIKIYTAKKYDKNDEKLKNQICERCGNLSNSFLEYYFRVDKNCFPLVVCPLCLGTEYGFKEDKKYSKLFMKAIKYNGKTFKKLKKEYKKFLKENKNKFKFLKEKNNI